MLHCNSKPAAVKILAREPGQVLFQTAWRLELSTNLRDVFTVPGEAFSLMKAPTSASKIKNLFRHLNMYWHPKLISANHVQTPIYHSHSVLIVKVLVGTFI